MFVGALTTTSYSWFGTHGRTFLEKNLLFVSALILMIPPDRKTSGPKVNLLVRFASLKTAIVTTHVIYETSLLVWSHMNSREFTGDSHVCTMIHPFIFKPPTYRVLQSLPPIADDIKQCDAGRNRKSAYGLYADVSSLASAGSGHLNVMFHDSSAKRAPHDKSGQNRHKTNHCRAAVVRKGLEIGRIGKSKITRASVLVSSHPSVVRDENRCYCRPGRPGTALVLYQCTTVPSILYEQTVSYKKWPRNFWYVPIFVQHCLLIQNAWCGTVPGLYRTRPPRPRS